MHEKIIILDFGSQYTQLIARRVREWSVYSEIIPYSKSDEISWDNSIKGLILAGSPCTVTDEGAPSLELNKLLGRVPILGICYGAQLIAHLLNGKVHASNKREYGRARLNKLTDDVLLEGMSADSQVWMSHGDTIEELPVQFELTGSTASVEVASFRSKEGQFDQPVYGLQFHPEVTHSEEGTYLMRNFLIDICGCKCDWTPESFVDETVDKLKNTLGDDKVVLGLSGGVDSTVAAMLIHKAIGKNLYCIFVDNGLLRKNEFDQVLHSYRDMGLNIKGVDAGDEFLDALEGVSDPERKRKIIGKTFIDVFDREAHLIQDVKWLGQGTIYPDVIESVSVHGPSVTIKSHHNVGGLPEKLNLKVIEPLRFLFKDEVRKVGSALGIPQAILGRHPFPGPGLAIRVLGDITREKLRILREADAIFISGLRDSGQYDRVWQAGVMLLPVQSVGVMGDERTYENVVALRAVHSVDGMTADWVDFSHEFLAGVSNRIINNVKGINRVVYDISSKPPSTIEWE